VVEELQNGALQRVYTYGHDLLVMDQRTPTGVWEARWYAYDGHGSVRLLTDGTARATDRYDYDAFGNLLAQWVSNPQTGALDLLAPGNAHLATPNTHLYCGEAYVPALGLYHLRARLMNPLTGRFWTMDSYEGGLGDPLSLHKYLYANADPVNGWDPSGYMALVSQTKVVALQTNISRDIIRRSTQKTFKRVITQITCGIGVASFRIAVEGLDGHHPKNKSFGGDPKQDQIWIPEETHVAYHRVLNILLRSEPEFKGRGNWTSNTDWKGVLKDRAAQELLIYNMRVAARFIDRKCKLKAPNSLTYALNQALKTH
jgi:RHS repeat-associated protein